MSTVTAKITQRADIRILLDKWAKERILDMKEIYMTKLVSNYNTSPLRATGKFGQSIQYAITDKGLEVYTNVDYLKSMVTGDSAAEASKQDFDTHYREILKWATDKPVKLKNGMSITSFAYLATKNIRKFGTTVYQLYGKRNKDTGLVNDAFSESEILELLADLSVSIQDEFIKEFKTTTFS